MTVLKEILPRQLLGTCAQLFLYLTDPQRYSEQIALSQQTLIGIVHSFFELGRQIEIMQSIGPLLFSSLRPSVPEETELANYLDIIASLEPEKENPSLTELISGFDHIIILLGRKASGKGTVSQILNEDYGFPNWPTSDWLRATAATRGYPEPFNPVMLRELGDELRQEFGGKVLVWLTLQEYALKDHKNIVLDGLRSETEMDELIKSSNVSFVWVDAPDGTRLKRVKGRKRLGDPQTIEELLAVDEKSFPEADRLKQLCTHEIDNPGDDINELKAKTEVLMTQFSIKKPNIIIVGGFA